MNMAHRHPKLVWMQEIQNVLSTPKGIAEAPPIFIEKKYTKKPKK